MAFETIDAYIAEVGGRSLAAAEWGLSADGVEIGLRVSDEAPVDRLLGALADADTAVRR